MDLEAIHKYISLNKQPGGITEVMFAGVPCLNISQHNSWQILPIFAKLVYGAQTFQDIPYCTENYKSIEQAVAGGLMKLYSIGAFSTCIDLPEDSYAGTNNPQVDAAASGVNEDFTMAAIACTNSLYEASQYKNKLLHKIKTVNTLDEETNKYIITKITSGESLTQFEQKVVIESLNSGEMSFLDTESGLFIGSKMTYTPIDEPSIQESTETSIEAIETIAEEVNTFSSWRRSKPVLVAESRKLITTHKNDAGTKLAKVYKDSETGEHVVKFHKDGVHQKDADYFTNDKSDAVGTAKHWLKEDINEQVFLDDDLYVVDHTKKKVIRHLGKQRQGDSYNRSEYYASDIKDKVNHSVKTGMEIKRNYTFEDRSEYTANQGLSGDADNVSAPKKKVRLVSPKGSVISHHDSEGDAIKAFGKLKETRGVKIVSEDSGKEMQPRDFIIQYETKDGKKKKSKLTAWSPRSVIRYWPEREKEYGHKLVDIQHNGKSVMNESKDDSDSYDKWVKEINKVHSDKKLKFKGRIESGNHTTSAEESGKDRSYGVYDHDSNTGHVFHDESFEIVGQEYVPELIDIEETLIREHTFTPTKYTSGFVASIQE